MADNLEAIAQHRATWMQALSPEDCAKVREDKQQVSENEDVRNDRAAEAVATFQAADTDADGRLNKEEFRDFMNKMSLNAGARGVPAMTEADCDEEMQEKIWAYFDSIDGDVTNGVSIDCVKSGMQAIGARCAEIMGN